MAKHRLIIVLLAFTIAGLVLSGCSGEPAGTGTLEGTVSIGPIFPVEQEGESRRIPPEVYEARKVMVYDKRGDKLVRQLDLEDDGFYRAELAPGSYVVDINRIGIDSSSDVPVTVEIKAGYTVELNIGIDTGIR